MSVRGLNELAEIIDLLKNPAKYDAKIEQLRGEIERYHIAIESVTKLSEVNEYTNNIKVKSAEIDKVYEKAQQDSQALLKQAQSDLDEARKIIKEDKEKLKVREAKVKSIEDEQLKNAKAQSEFAERLETKNFELFSKETELNKLAQDLAERKAKLLAAIG